MRRFLGRHPVVVDALLAIHVALPIIGVLTEEEPSEWPVSALHLAALLALGAMLLLRRQRPLAVFIASTVVVTLMIGPTQGNIDIFAIPAALYAVAVYKSNRAAWVCLAVAATATTVAGILGAAPEDRVAMVSLFCTVMLVVTLIGTNVGNSRRYTAALVGRAEQLARERDQQAQLAAAAERARIAREMHDIVAHSLTVIVALANGADATAENAPDQARMAMREVRDVGRGAISDMRRLLGVLREDATTDTGASVLAERHPQPGNDDLAGLVETFRAAGLPVTLTLSGPAPTGAGVQLTVHRIVQEALTNVLRYADEPTAVSVRVITGDSQIEIDVRDNGRGRSNAPGAATVEGSGQGLIGMRERVSLYSGTLDVGPGSTGGWHVHALLFVDLEDS